MLNLPRLLTLTGYGPFLNYTTNPSEDLAKALHGSTVFNKLTINSTIVDVNEASVSSFDWDRSAGTGRTDVVVHMGFESEAKGLKIEVAAVNVRALTNGTGKIDGSAPYLLPTTLDLRRFDSDVYSEFSRDAGTYFCNEIYFRSLDKVRRGSESEGYEKFKHSGQSQRLPTFTPVVFIHVPPYKEMPFNTMLAEVKKILEEVVRSSYFEVGEETVKDLDSDPEELTAILV